MTPRDPAEHNKRQAAFYERVAGSFDRSVWSMGNRDNRNHAAKARALADALDLASGPRVLEVGSGTGLHARWILTNTPAVYTGLDLSPPMSRLAAERIEREAPRPGTLVVGDALRLPFPDGAFDAAFASGTVHHVPDPAASIRELVRVVRPGGRVAALEPNPFFPSMAIAATFVAAERGSWGVTAPKLARWGRAAGLHDVSVRRLLYTPPKPARWASAFDRIDGWAGRAAGLRRLSIMMLLSGSRPDDKMRSI